jgi:hypothetical protein
VFAPWRVATPDGPEFYRDRSKELTIDFGNKLQGNKVFSELVHEQIALQVISLRTIKLARERTGVAVIRGSDDGNDLSSCPFPAREGNRRTGGQLSLSLGALVRRTRVV